MVLNLIWSYQRQISGGISSLFINFAHIFHLFHMFNEFPTHFSYFPYFLYIPHIFSTFSICLINSLHIFHIFHIFDKFPRYFPSLLTKLDVSPPLESLGNKSNWKINFGPALHRFPNDLCTNVSPISVELYYWQYCIKSLFVNYHCINIYWRKIVNSYILEGLVKSDLLSCHETIFTIEKRKQPCFSTSLPHMSDCFGQLTSKAEKVQDPNLRSHFWSSNGNHVMSDRRKFDNL